MKILRALALPLLWLIVIPVAASAFPVPPQPSKAVELKRYIGRWYEIARVPNRFERGKACDAPSADYQQDASGAVSVVQTCHVGSVSGPQKIYHATVKILDPGTNAKFRLTFYAFFSKDYWVLDHAPDYDWAIVGDPTGKFLWLFSRAPTVSAALKQTLLERSKTLGYDIGRLEFPDQT